MTPAAAYGVLDGLFQQALLGHVAGDASALPTLVDQVHGLMPLTAWRAVTAADRSAGAMRRTLLLT